MNGRPPRTYLIDAVTGEHKPLTPEGIAGTLASPDAKSLVVTAQGALRMFRIDDGVTAPIKGLAQGDQVIRWSGDGSRAVCHASALAAPA